MKNKYISIKLFTLVNPVGYSIVNSSKYSRVGYLIVIGHLCVRSVVDIILVNVDQGVAPGCPSRELQRRRLIRCQYCLRSVNITITYFVIHCKQWFVVRYFSIACSFQDGPLAVFTFSEKKTR